MHGNINYNSERVEQEKENRDQRKKAFKKPGVGMRDTIGYTEGS